MKPITVEQFQRLHKATQMDGDVLERETELVSIATSKSIEDVDAMPMAAFLKCLKNISNAFQWLTFDLNYGKPPSHIRVNGTTYKLNYRADLIDLKAGQYVDVMSYSRQAVDGMHLVLASLAVPMRYSFLRAKYVPFERAHKDIANDMLQANFKDAYHVYAFFLTVWQSSMKDIKGFLEVETAKSLTGLLSTMDGLVMPKWSRKWRAAH